MPNNKKKWLEYIMERIRHSPKMTHYYICDTCGKTKKTRDLLISTACMTEDCMSRGFDMHGFYKYIGSTMSNITLLSYEEVYALKERIKNE